jgi:pyruvate-formate lyase-activating enzyme
VYNTNAKIRPAAGVRAWTRLLDKAAIDLKNIDIDKVAKKLTKRKKKKAPGSRRKFYGGRAYQRQCRAVLREDEHDLRS